MGRKKVDVALVQKRFERLEEAFEVMMEIKRNKPTEVIAVYPDGEDEAEEWDNSGYYVSTYPSCTNAPIIGSMDDCLDLSREPRELLEMVADEKKYISGLADRICKESGVSGDAGWRLTALGLESPFEIYLFMEPDDWQKVVEKVTEFNNTLSQDGFTNLLTLDSRLMMVGGEYREMPVTGGFFEKRRVRKLNEKYKADFFEILDRLQDHMRRL